MSINEAIQSIKRVGTANARAVKSDSAPGRYQIEIRDGGEWTVIESTKGLSQKMAEDLILQSTNRVILG